MEKYEKRDSIKDTEKPDNNVESAESISVCQPGSNMLWVEIDWGDEKETIDIKATARNKMLFDRDEFMFDGKSLYSLLFGDEHSRAVLMRDPYVAVKPGPYNDTYRIWVEDEVMDVLTPPSESKRVLDGIVICAEDRTHIPLKNVCDDIIKNHINKNAVLNLLDSDYLDTEGRVEVKGDGLVVDDYFLLTWEAEFYVYTDQWKEGAFTPSGDSMDKPGQFREITVEDIPDDFVMTLNGVNYQMTELEWVFTRRLYWILNWKENIDDAEVSSVQRTIPILQEYNI